jgi:hypothetical protein
MAKTKKLGDLVNQTVTLSAPLSGTANLTDTLNFSITKANTTTDGYVSATDWNIFNNKQDALGFTPYNATNPDGFISGITSGMVTTALGFTPYDSSNPSGYITSSALTPYAPLSNPTFTTAITTPIVNGVSGNLAFANAVQTSGAITAFTFTKPNNTTQTASTSISGFVVNGGTRQWNTGNIATQNENVWGATTYSFVGASTITNAYGNVFNAPIAGLNCIITNNWAAQFNGKVQINGNLTNNGAIDSQYFLTVTNPNNVATATARIQVTNGAGNFGVLSITSNADAVDPSILLLGGSNKGIIFSSNSVQVLKVFDATRNFLIQSGGTLTDAGFKLDVNGTGRFQNTLTLATGTTTIAPLKLTAGTNLTTPVNGSFEFDGTNLYFTVGGVRKTVTLI